MMKTAIVNAHIVTRDHLIKNGAICFENGVITSVGESLSRMASLTPARLMGWEDRGEIAVGKRADLVLLDEKLYPQRVFLGGAEI